MKIKGIKTPRLVVVAVFTTITLIFWVFYNIYSILTTTPPSKVPEELLLPINPELNMESLNQLSDRIFFEEADIEAMTTPIPTPTITLEPIETFEEEVETATAEATVSPTVTPTPTASE